MNKKLLVIISLLFILPGFKGFTIAQSGVCEALSLNQENMKSQTGVYSLEKGAESLLARLWFFDHAKNSIDIQYFSFAKDVTGLIATDHIVLAAERGVKIRILVDDAASKMYSYQLQVLDSHDNIEVKIYNAGLRLGRPDRRFKFLLKNAKRIFKRMHNKTLTIDHEACIMGGRNIADGYFDYSPKYNFRDRDALLIGKAAKDVSASFENFWNDKRTVLYSQLSGKEGKKWYSVADRFERLHKQAADTINFSNDMRKKISHFPDELKIASKSGAFLWITSISFVSDEPGKNEDRKDQKGGICTDSILNLVKQAKTSIILQSPYFILTDKFEQAFREAIQRGVKIRLLTNSLASIDIVSVFTWYRKDRKKILQLGIDLYEFKPDAQVRKQLMCPELQSKLKPKSVFGFHAKTIVIDENNTAIGSYNFDSQSADYNMECMSIIRSRPFAKNISTCMEEDFLPENSWHITLGCYPDSKAPVKKKIRAFFGHLTPKKHL